MHTKRLAAALMLAVALATMTGSLAGAHGLHSGRSFAICTAGAVSSTVYSDHTGYAGGAVVCSQQETYYWYISLRNHAGSNLISADGYYIDTTGVSTPRANCSGAIVHGYLYVNDNGAGSSNTESTEHQC